MLILTEQRPINTHLIYKLLVIEKVLTLFSNSTIDLLYCYSLSIHIGLPLHVSDFVYLFVVAWLNSNITLFSLP